MVGPFSRARSVFRVSGKIQSTGAIEKVKVECSDARFQGLCKMHYPAFAGSKKSTTLQ